MAAKDKLNLVAEREWVLLQQHMSVSLGAEMDETRRLFRAVGSLDVLGVFGRLSVQPGYCYPRLLEGGDLKIVQGRHPMLDAMMGGGYVAANVEIPSGGTWILTGPNMGGKSALMRTVGLLALMGQIGSPVPAEECTLPIFEAIFCRMGVEDAMLDQKSTFMVEMLETSAILSSPCLRRSLVLMDELGQGTSSFDGLAVASATLNYLVRNGGSTIFVTHHTVLCDHFRDGQHPNVICKYMAFAYLDGSGAKKIKFLHTPVDGVTPSSFGVEVAGMSNLPSEVISIARGKSLWAEEQQRQRVSLHALASFLNSHS
jgi:DNA mismatch repair protein MSH3